MGKKVEQIARNPKTNANAINELDKKPSISIEDVDNEIKNNTIIKMLSGSQKFNSDNVKITSYVI